MIAKAGPRGRTIGARDDVEADGRLRAGGEIFGWQSFLPDAEVGG